MHDTKHGGFTLAELLIAIVIVGIVATFATVTYNRIFGTVDLEEVQQRAAQVELFVKQLEILDVPANEVAERINSNPDFRDTSLAEKVIGSIDYLKKHVAKGVNVCNPPSGVTGHKTGNPTGPVYTFLNILDGPSKTPSTATRPGGNVIGNNTVGFVPKTSDLVHCISPGIGIFNITIRVDDDNNWWCIPAGTNTKGEYYSTVVASGQLRGFCLYRTQGHSRSNRALLESKIDDNFGS